MKKIASVVAMILLWSVTSLAQEERQDEDWSQLFNGKDLEAWDIKIAGRNLNDNFGETFLVENGVLKISYDQYDDFGGRFGHIFFREKFSHYILRVEYRFVGEQVAGGPDWALRNNGIMIHSQSAGSMTKEQDFPISIEVQLLGGTGTGERNTANLCTPGTHVVMNNNLVTEHCMGSRSKTYHGEQWANLEVEVLGTSRITHKVDGEVVLTYEKPQIGGGVVHGFDAAVKQDGAILEEGFIALQSESHPTEFRKVELLSLVGCMDPEATNFKSYYVEPDNSLCRYESKPAAAAFETNYQEGKVLFYQTLKEQSARIPLTAEDREKLQSPEREFPHLFEHLMNFYFYVRLANETDNISSQMAEELINSIPSESLQEDVTPLTSLLSSAGYFSSNRTPPFRRFARPVAKTVKSQSTLRAMGLQKAHSITEGKGIRLAIIDSGIDLSIQDLRSKTVKHKNFLDGSTPLGDKGTFPFDWDGHGTSVASLITQVAPETQLLVVKVYDAPSMKTAPFSKWTSYLLAAGMIWAAQNGAEIINLSFAVKTDIPAIREAAKYCWENNVVVVTSMGNAYDGREKAIPYYPARYPTTIAVSGIENNKGDTRVWRHSTFGSYIDVAAPADDLWVEAPSYRMGERGARKANGNSLATSVVAGTAALVVSAMDEQTRQALKAEPGGLCEAVRQILRDASSNEQLGFDTPNPFAGYGIVDIDKAVRAAKAAGVVPGRH